MGQPVDCPCIEEMIMNTEMIVMVGVNPSYTMVDAVHAVHAVDAVEAEG